MVPRPTLGALARALRSTAGGPTRRLSSRTHRLHVIGVGVVVGLLVAGCDPGPIATVEEPFEQGRLDGYSVAQPTAIAWGPDDRLYVATLGGGIDALTIDGGIVEDIEMVVDPAEGRYSTILGIAFNPVDTDLALYFAENKINGSSAGDPFPNRIIKLSGEGWSDEEVVISGLPTSGHNHGTNQIIFDDSGRLYIAQGGTTSSGAPSEPGDPRWLGWDETPLSAAILVAEPNAPGFDGQITYDTAEASSETNLVSGDVRVWSTGHRNTYGFTLHSNGGVYALDNGSSEPLPASADCDRLESPPENDPDQLNLVVEGAYYGHPNRNRARTNPAECVYIAPEDEARDSASNMLTLVPPSSNAVIEFQSDAFDGGWRGDLVYAWWSGGEIRRLELSADGREVLSEELISDGYSLPIAMVQAPDDTIYIAEFGGSIAYLKPQE